MGTSDWINPKLEFGILCRKENERENPSKLCGIYQKKIDSAEFLHDMAMG
jgi:hypothetical protein